MTKVLESLFLLFVSAILCVVLPMALRRGETNLVRQTQAAYEADYLAWEIRTYRVLDASVLPSGGIMFYCYDRNMEQAAILTAGDILDFNPYYCVIFIYEGKKEGVCLE